MNICKGCSDRTDGCMKQCTKKLTNDLVNWIMNDKRNKARRKQKTLDSAYYESTMRRYGLKQTENAKF